MPQLMFVKGEDSLGKFTLEESIKGCPVCKKRNAVVVHYHSAPKVSSYVKSTRSLLLRINTQPRLHRSVGITCGCYAKVHRQIAHIGGGRKS